MTERAQVAAEVLDWRQPILTMPLKQAFPDLAEVREFKSKHCIFNHDRSRLFNVVSPKYQVIEHGRAIDTILAALDALGEKDPEVNVRSLAGGARINAEIKIKTIIPAIEVRRMGDQSDLVQPRIIVRNSHDGLWRFSARLGGWRMVCSNGLVVGVTLASLSGKHFPNMGNNEAFTARMEDLVKRFVKVGAVWKSWDDTKLTHDDAKFLLKPEKELLPKKVLQRVLDESHFQPNRSKWDLFNDLTYITTHEAKSLNRRIDLDEVIEKLFYSRADLAVAEAA
jgi:hypothetical protein